MPQQLRLEALAFLSLLIAGCQTPATPLSTPLTFGLPSCQGGPAILLPVSFDGQQCFFLVDTGSSRVVFDESLRPKLGRPWFSVNVECFSGQKERRDFFDCPDAFLGPISLAEGGSITCADFSSISFLCGQDIKGILGMSVLRRYVLSFDLDKATARISGPSGCVLPANAERLPLTFGRGRVPQVVALRAQCEELSFILDTGYNDNGAAPRSILQPLPTRMPAHSGASVEADGQVVLGGACGLLPELTMGRFVYHNLVLDDSDRAVLGLKFIGRHHVVFDFPNKTLYLGEPRPLSSCSADFRGGLLVSKEVKGLRITFIDHGGAAEAAGLRIGDVITRIDDHDAAELELWQAGRMLHSREPRSVLLRYVRDNDSHSCTMALRSEN